MTPYELLHVIAQIPPPPMDVPMPIRKALLVDRESKAVNYLICREYELNKTSWSKLQKKYNVSRNKIYAAPKGKGRPRVLYNILPINRYIGNITIKHLLNPRFTKAEDEVGLMIAGHIRPDQMIEAEDMM